ncbi:unnamed protein product [Echinostoma caproni]|uniref:ANK_REP_REGION domain-containing protein n=1 Tax=Echinostoma caproni TaxID=27848 RepID=A0A183A5D7_9TREM|nr:unnamed protein product [Echinostoma caproni]
MNSPIRSSYESLEPNPSLYNSFLLCINRLRTKSLMSKENKMRLMWTKIAHRTKEQIRRIIFLANDQFWTADRQDSIDFVPTRRRGSRLLHSITLRRTASSQPLLEENAPTVDDPSTETRNISSSSCKIDKPETCPSHADSRVVRPTMGRKRKVIGRPRTRPKQRALACRTRTFGYREISAHTRSSTHSLFCLAAYHHHWDDFELFLDIGFDLNVVQTYFDDYSSSDTMRLHFTSVIDLFLHVIQQKQTIEYTGNNLFGNNSRNERSIFPQLLSMLLNKGADVRLLMKSERDDCSFGGIHLSRISKLFQIASTQLSERFAPDSSQIEEDLQIDAAGIIRQLLQSGLQVPLGKQHISDLAVQHKFTSPLYTVLLQCLSRSHDRLHENGFSASLQSFIILWLNVIYSSPSCDQSFFSVPTSEFHHDKHMLAYHDVFQRFHRPPRLFFLARNAVRRLIGTRWFRPIVTETYLNPSPCRKINTDPICVQRSQALRGWLSSLSDPLRRAVAYLEANDLRYELQCIRLVNVTDSDPLASQRSIQTNNESL